MAWLRETLTYVLVPLFYVSGLLVWPMLALLWRGQGLRKTAVKCVFWTELGCLMVLAGFEMFSQGLLEHGYYWCVLMILANLIFTPLALIAATFDYGRGKPIRPVR